MDDNIQFITENFKENSYNITVSTFNHHNAFNSFDFNVIDFNKKCLWDYDYIRNEYKVDSLLDSLRDSIRGANDKTKFIFLIPQNLKIDVDIVNKDYLSNHREILENYFYHVSTINFSLILGTNITKIDDIEVNSDFYFEKSNLFDIIKTNRSGDATIIQKNNFVLTTLNINDLSSLNFLINEINVFNKKIEAPVWLDNFKFFRDRDQLNLIEIYENQIKNIDEKIRVAKGILEENNKFKSVLYTNNDALVDVVFEMLEKLLDCDLSGFVDVYDEDFFIEKDEISFIGEIKGVGSNAKNQHLSQLNDHCEKKGDLLKKEGIVPNLKQILIINTFRNMPPDERPEIEEETINKAKNIYSSLIIKTVDLLNLFEIFKKGLITSDEIIERFKNDVGLFKL